MFIQVVGAFHWPQPVLISSMIGHGGILGPPVTYLHRLSRPVPRLFFGLASSESAFTFRLPVSRPSTLTTRRSPCSPVDAQAAPARPPPPLTADDTTIQTTSRHSHPTVCHQLAPQRRIICAAMPCAESAVGVLTSASVATWCCSVPAGPWPRVLLHGRRRGRRSRDRVSGARPTPPTLQYTPPSPPCYPTLHCRSAASTLRCTQWCQQ